MPTSCVIGLDLGGTKLLAGAVDAQLNVLHRVYRMAPIADRAEGVMAFLTEVLEELIAQVEADGGSVEAVGVGIPSLIDQARGIAVSTVHQPLNDTPVRDLLQARLQRPVALDNDANCAMLAEWRAGAALGTDDAVLLTIGTGIGSGVVSGGMLLRGATGAATELGHTVIAFDGPPCQGACPNRGCLEAMASGSALGREGVRTAQGHPGSSLARMVAAGDEVQGVDVVGAARAGDPAGVEALEHVGRLLGVGIANVMNTFNPEVVLIGGGASAAGELLLVPARAEARSRALAPARDARVEIPRFGAEAGMVGAAVLAWDAIAGAAGKPE